MKIDNNEKGKAKSFQLGNKKSTINNKSDSKSNQSFRLCYQFKQFPLGSIKSRKLLCQCTNNMKKPFLNLKTYLRQLFKVLFVSN